MQFGESFSDSLVQQLLRQPLSLLTNMSFELNDAQYASAEVCFVHITICTWLTLLVVHGMPKTVLPALWGLAFKGIAVFIPCS
jgi:hypothetical protein